MKEFLRYLYVVAAMLLVVVGDVWGKNLQFQNVLYGTHSTTFDDDDLKKITNGTAVNNVKFSISDVSYFDNGLQERLDYSDQAANTTKTSIFSWAIANQNTNNPYSVQVSNVSCDIRGYQAKISPKSATAYFEGNSAVDCKTNSLGNGGAKTVSTSGVLGSSTLLYMVTGGNKTSYTLQNIKYDYKVYQSVPVFQYKVVAIASPNEGGNVYASFAENSFSSSVATTTSYSGSVLEVSTGMSKTAYFKAVAKEGYNFVGWKRNLSDDSYVSTSAIYSESLTSRTNDADAPATITMYAIFMAKNQPLFSGSKISGVKVGESVPTSFVFEHVGDKKPTANENDDFYYVIQHYPDASSKADSPNPNLVVSYNPNTNQIIGLNSGTAKITFIHKDNDDYYYAESEAYEIAVIKHQPEFKWHGQAANVNTIEYFNNLYADFFISSSSTNNASLKLTYSSSDEDVATLSTSSNAQKLNLTTYNKEASTTLTVNQAENYYWYGKTETKVVTPIDPNNHVPFVIDSEEKRNVFDVNWVADEYTWDNGIQLGDWTDGGSWADKYVDIEFRGVPDKLTFNTSVKEAGIFPASDIYWYVKESEDGVNWSGEIWKEEDTKNITITDSIQLQPKTRFIRMCYSGNFGGVFHNITVTERDEFHAVDKSDENEEVEHLNFGENQVYTEKSLSFDLKYANAGYKVRLESSDPTRFKVNPSTINTIGGCKFGKETISVTYSSKDAYSTTGKDNYIVISDELAELKGHRDTVFLTASSDKAVQTLKWQDKYQTVEIPNVRITEERILRAAESTSKLTVKYESLDPEVIEVQEDTILVLKKVGEAVIIARQGGNEMWHAADSIIKTFRVTDKILQHIAWNDDLTHLELGDADVTLTAMVSVWDEEKQEYIYNEERTQLLQYSVEDVSIASIKDKVLLQINSVGETTATVEIEGDDTYEATSLSVPVHVRTASSGCDDKLLVNHKKIEFFQMNLNEIIEGPLTINRELGLPATLSFQHYGDFWTLLGVKYYAGSIRPEYTTVDDPDIWVPLQTITPIRGKVMDAEMELPRNADKIRFVRPYGGEGYHYIQNIKVYPAQYIEAVEAIDCGEIFVGSKTDTAFVVNFCNIKGAAKVSTSSNDVVVMPTSFGECGDYGSQNISVTWIPSKVNDNAVETITLKDNVSGMVCVVELRAKVSKGIQNINMVYPSVLSDCEYVFPTLTTADLPITWTIVEGDDCAHFEGNKLILDRTGKVTINGLNPGTENYHSVSINYTFTINYDPIFLGKVDTDWKKVENWSICRLPDENDIVTIKALVELDTIVVVKGLKFADAGVMHIADSVGMTIGSYGLELTTDGLITIDNTPIGAGFLKVHPDAANKPGSKVTINYATAAYNSGYARDEIWQYMGAPGEEMEMSDVDKTLIYYWSEENGWLKQSQGTSLTPFYGYAFTQNKGTAENPEASFEIKAKPIISDKIVDLTCTQSGMRGGNVFVNSYLAPIDVASIDPEEDLEGVDGAFYLFKSGSWTQWQNQGGSTNTMSGDGTSPGQYYAITPGAAAMIDANEDQTTIPPMQGAYVVASKDDAKIKLDYEKHVYGATASNRPMRAPEMRNENFKRVRLQVNSQNSGADRMYVIQHEDATKGYDYGYDAKNILAEDQVNIYTSEQGGQMEISVSNRIDSTYIGFQAGSDTEYSLRITSVVGEKLYLKDLENETLVALMDGEEYVFQAAPKSVNNKRFLLIDKLAGVDNEEVKVYIYDNVVHVLDAPKDSDMVVYTVGGLMVARYTIWDTPCTVELSGLPNGVYLVRIANKSYKFVCN